MTDKTTTSQPPGSAALTPAAIQLGRDLHASGWVYDSVTLQADGTTIRALHQPATGRRIDAHIGVDESTTLTLTGLSLAQVAGAIHGAGLVDEPTTPAPSGPVRPWQDPPQVPQRPGPMGPQPRYQQTSTADDLARLVDVRRLAMDYANGAPPILANPPTEWGKGFIAGLQHLARAVLDTLDGPADMWPCCGWPDSGPHGDGCQDNWVR